MLGGSFGSVQLIRRRAHIEVPEAAPVVDFVASMRGLRESELPSGVPWEAFLAAVAAEVEETVRTAGAFRLRSDVGLVVARP